MRSKNSRHMEIKNFKNNSIRLPAVAGTFYPAGKDGLLEIIKGFFANIPKVKNEKIPRIIIVPHAGYIYSGQTAAFAWAPVSGYEKIILLGPAHTAYLKGVVADGHEFWQTPLGRVKIFQNHNFEIDNTAHENEHCLEVQLPFLQYVMGNDFEILPLLAGEVDAVKLGQKIQNYLDGKTLLAVSSDLSHYHDCQTATKLDRQTIAAVESLMPENIAEACGRLPMETAIAIARARGWKAKLLDYKNSGDTAGGKTQVVGYAAMAFYD